MLVKDGDGNFVDFAWPSFWYLVKAGIAVTFGVILAGLVSAVVLFPMWMAFIGGVLRAMATH